MQYLIKICLTLAERLEDRRGTWRARRETERKTILTFLSQGAVGGMIGYFLVTVCSAALYPNVYSFLYFIALPIILVFGASCGAVAGMFVWLPGVLLKRRLGFAARAVITVGSIWLLGIAFSYWVSAQEPNELSMSWLIGSALAVNLPIVLITGSVIRPGRLLVFGAGGRLARRRFRHWLVIPPGFLLRATSIFGMLEAFLALAVWISVRTSPWSDVSGRDALPAIVLAITYFVASSYLSLKTPRRMFLLPLAIALNVPAVFLMISEKQVGNADSDFLAYSYFGFICLWTVYTFGCLIAPVADSRAARLINGTFILKKTHNATVMV